jgi:hypothetical protein
MKGICQELFYCFQEALAVIGRWRKHTTQSNRTHRLVIEGLAKNATLFSRSDVPPLEGRTNILYQIASDPDGQFTLYVSSANQRKETPPHNHATWGGDRGYQRRRAQQTLPPHGRRAFQ